MVGDGILTGALISIQTALKPDEMRDVCKMHKVSADVWLNRRVTFECHERRYILFCNLSVIYYIHNQKLVEIRLDVIFRK